MTTPETGELSPLSPDHPDYSLYVEHIGPMVRRLMELEGLPGMARNPRVGTQDFGDWQLPARINGLGEAHVWLSGAEQDVDRSIDVARSYALQALESVPAGAVRLSVYNGYMGRHTGAFSDFAKGLGPKLYKQAPRGKLTEFLDSIEARNLALANRHVQSGDQAEPWQISVILAEADELGKKELKQLNLLIAAGPRYGSIVAIGPKLQSHEDLHDGWHFPVHYDAPIVSEDIRERCQRIAIEANKGEATPELSSIMPEQMWTKTAHHGIEVTIGTGEDGEPFTFTLDDQAAHGLLLGPTGKGKSVVLRDVLASVTQNYSPDEIEVTLVDYKEGVEFASYARKDAPLPHADHIAINIGRDPEYGLAVLKGLWEEYERRGGEFRGNVRSYAEMRALRPDERLPRKLLVIDEVQTLLKSECGEEAVALLDGIARKGRAFGIHLLLASQTVDGIPALARTELWENFALRIATPEGSLLRTNNHTPASLPKYHVVVNTMHGNPEANHVVKVANSTDGRDLPYQKRAHAAHLEMHPEAKPPRVFDSAIVPKLENAKAFRRLRPVDLNPAAVLAEEMTTKERSAKLVLSRDPGKNLAVIGVRRDEVNSVLYSAALSLGKQQTPEAAQFSIVCLDTQSAEAINATATGLREQGHDVEVVRPANAPAFFTDINKSLDPRTERSHFVVVYGADAGAAIMSRPQEIEHIIEANGRTIRVENGDIVMKNIQTIVGDRHSENAVKAPAGGVVEVRDEKVVIIKEESQSGRDHFFEILKHGPESGVHLVASFASVGRLEGVASRFRGGEISDLIGAYVSIGIPPSELRSITPGASVVSQAVGHDRDNRALFFDGSHSRMVVPYAGPANREADEE